MKAISKISARILSLQRYFSGRNGTGVNVIARHAVLRPISTLLIVTTASLSLQPLIVVAQTKDSGTLPPQIGQWLPKTQAAQAAVGARRVQSPSDAAPTPSGLIAIEEALKRAVPERFATAQQLKSVSTDQVLIRTAHTVLAQQDSVAAEAQQAREQFTVDRERLQQASLEGNTARVDPAMLQRHTDTVAAFEARASEFDALMQGLKRSTSQDATQNQSADTKSALQALAAFIKKYPNQRAHQATDPNNLPFKLAKAEVRAPIEDGQALARYSAQAQRSKRGMPTPAASLYPLLPDIARRIERAPLNIPTPAQMDRLDRAKSATTKAASAADILPPAAADLAETEDVQLTPAIRTKAAALNYNPVEIYNWVRNTIEFLPTYGSIQGSDMTLMTGKGNAFDTASLTIALLRASDIYAKYVYGTVEIPADQVQNWVGNVKTPEAAQSLMSQGGIPNVALISGGKIAAFRLEHVWVEAYVNYYPSRGANHRGEPANTPASPRGTPGDTWVPFDASFKQFAYASGMQISKNVPFNATGLNSDLGLSSATVAADGTVPTLAETKVTQSLDQYRGSVRGYIAGRSTNPTVGDVIGDKQIVASTLPYFAGTLQQRTLSVASRFATIPTALRWSIEFGMYSSALARATDSPDATATRTLPTLAGKRIGFAYEPSSQADRDIIQAAFNAGQKTFSAYTVNVTPTLRVEGESNPVAGSPSKVGQAHILSVTINAPWYQSPRDYNVTSGDIAALSLDVQGVCAKQLNDRTSRYDFNSLNGLDFLSESLHQTGLGWWGQKAAYYDITSTQTDVIAYRLPSHALISHPITARYAFGVARSASFKSRVIDGKENLIAATHVEGKTEPRRSFLLTVGSIGSFLEGHMLEQAFLREGATGVSTTAILKYANERGVPIHVINAQNASAALAVLQVTSDVRDDIHNAVNAGLRVTIPRRDITVANYTGTGYFIEDPETGTGAYLIDGGRNGGGGPAGESVYPLPEIPASPIFGIMVGSTLRSAGMSLIAENGVIVGAAMPTIVGEAAGAAVGAAAASAAAVLIAILLILILLTAFISFVDSKYPRTTGYLFRHYTSFTEQIMAQFLRVLIASRAGTFGPGVYVADAVSENSLGAGCPPGPGVQARFQIPNPPTGYVDFEIYRPAFYTVSSGTNSVGGVEYLISSPLFPWPHPAGGIGKALYIGEYAFGLQLTDTCF